MTKISRAASANLVLTALIDGLRVPDDIINVLCGAALCGIGRRMTSQLAAAAQSPSVSAVQSQRLESVIEFIEKRADADVDSESVLLALLHCLHYADAALSRNAANALRSLAPTS